MATESWVVAGPQIIEIEAVSTLQVQLVGGRVDVVAHDGPGARIEVHAVDGRPLEITLSDGELRVGYQFTLGGWDGFLEKFRNFGGKDRADVHIAVPREVRAKVGTVSADGLLAGVVEDASVSTVSGTLITDGTRGRLGAKTVSGEIVVRDHRGDLRLNSVSGELAASGELSLVQANSVSGVADARRPLRHVQRHRVDRVRRRHRPAPRRQGRAGQGEVGLRASRRGRRGVQGVVTRPAQGRPAQRRRRVLRLGQHRVRPRDRAARLRRRRRGGLMMAPVFAHGQLRLYLLSLLESGPKHGYELITDLSDRFGGTYRPSPGTVYPRLARLEEEGLVVRVDEERKSTYALTDAGRAELEARRGDLASLEEGIAESVRERAAEVRDDVRGSMRGLRADLAAAAQRARAEAVPHTASHRRTRAPRRTCAGPMPRSCCSGSATRSGPSCARRTRRARSSSSRSTRCGPCSTPP